ncbi:MAG TPA: M48 family metalloprotease [Thermoanaerobaculia bacterium]|nr:M48 family metalloprotease [Thermoanaerobaculia bacterium]
MRTAIATTLALFLAATASAQGWRDVIGKINPDKIKKGANVLSSATKEFTEDEEADIGRVVAARVLATYPLAADEKLQKYVTLVGNTVAAYSARPTLEWHFAVIDTPIVNAFSCPGGFIFITSGAMKMIKSEAELAAVLGHEIGHTTQKHILKEIKRASTISAGLDLAKTTSSGSFLNDEIGQKISDLAYEKLFTKGLSQRDEFEADKVGVELAAAAGYRSAELVTFIDDLGKHEKVKSSMLATHPSPSDRIAAIKPLIDQDGEVLAERWAQWTQLSAK